MGRPIKKRYFSAKTGSIAGDLTLTTGASGDEVVIKQTGTGVYEVASGRAKLTDPNAPGYAAVDPDSSTGVVGTALLTHDNGTDGALNVRKISQYRVYYFDSAVGSAVWRDGDGNTIGTFVPAFTNDPGTKITATATATQTGGVVDDSVVVVNGGKGYESAPSVTIAGASAGSGAVATATLTDGVVTSIAVSNGGTLYDAPLVVTIAAP